MPSLGTIRNIPLDGHFDIDPLSIPSTGMNFVLKATML
jgi:hypothetical protein